jgi:REP element-mobilizing transposase RayT
LYDAVPATVLQSWKDQLAWVERLPPTDPREVELRERLARYEDAGHGAAWLRDPSIAACVEDALLYFDAQHYLLLTWCVMPNHVHALIETLGPRSLAEIVHSWKSFTAHAANRLLGRSGDFWLRDYHDRFIRDDDHFAKAFDYIEQNPVKAGLVGSRDEWRWSSAWKERA